MRLNTNVRNQLSDALNDAFRSHEAFERVLRRIGVPLANFTSSQFNLPTIIDTAIETMESREKIPEFLVAAREINPENKQLKNFVIHFSLISSFISDNEILAMFPHSQIDPAVWRDKLGKLERQICLIRIKLQNESDRDITGTGFLVGPDLVMTNYHVVECLFKPKLRENNQDWALPEDVTIQFDRVRLPDNRLIRKGVSHTLNIDNWRSTCSPDSPADKVPPPKVKLPKGDELDFAILRLKHPIDEEPAFDGYPRGYIELPQSPNQAAKQPLRILHFPEGRWLQMTPDASARLVGYNANGTRLFYDAPTSPGSSGAPIFDTNWRLVGIHRGGMPGVAFDTKEGIPIFAIYNFLNPGEKPPPDDKGPPNIPIETALTTIEQKFGFNWMFATLYKNVKLQGSEKELKHFCHWLNDVQSVGSDVVNAYGWQLLCLDKHIQLLGVPDMPPEFIHLFFEEFPTKKQDASRFFRFASKRVNEQLETITSGSNLLTQQQNLNRYVGVLLNTVTEIETLERELERIKHILNMYNCMVSESDEKLPHDNINSSLSQLKESLNSTVSELNPSGASLGVRVNVRKHLKKLQKEVPQYRHWLMNIAASIEKYSSHDFSLN